ncbi:molybdenum cofactor biosynthesis protein MoaE [soil metagenome]
MRTHFEITEAPLSIQDLTQKVAEPSAGAIATFTGTARNSFRGKDVEHLEYEAYVPLAEQALAEIGTEIADRWPAVTALAVAHRVGRVGVGEASVIVAVSAPHRREALAACAYGIDRLKAVLPVWKKEVFEDGEEWRENTPNRGGEPL